MSENKTTESVHDRILGGLKVLVGALLAVSLSLLIPLIIPLGFAGWLNECVIEAHLRFLGLFHVWPWAVKIAYLVFCYAYFIADVVLMFEAKRLWTFLLYLSVLVASTWASCHVLKDGLALPHN